MVRGGHSDCQGRAPGGEPVQLFPGAISRPGQSRGWRRWGHPRPLMVLLGQPTAALGGRLLAGARACVDAGSALFTRSCSGEATHIDSGEVGGVGTRLLGSPGPSSPEPCGSPTRRRNRAQTTPTLLVFRPAPPRLRAGPEIDTVDNWTRFGLPAKNPGLCYNQSDIWRAFWIHRTCGKSLRRFVPAS